MWASTRCPFCSSTRNIALGSGSTTRPSTSMAPSFFATPTRPPRSIDLLAPMPDPTGRWYWVQHWKQCWMRWCGRSRRGRPASCGHSRSTDGANANGHCTPTNTRAPTRLRVMKDPLAPHHSRARGGTLHEGHSMTGCHPERREAGDAAVLGRQHPRALRRDSHGVLEVRGAGAVLGDHGPAVLELLGGRVAHGHHRLDRQHQPGHQLGPPAGAAVVEHVRVLLHL